MRYNFSLLHWYVWKDMITKPRYFWGMWGVLTTLWFIVYDTANHPIV